MRKHFPDFLGKCFFIAKTKRKAVPDIAKKKHPGGRPPKFTTAEELQTKIEAYFTACEGRVLTDDNGNAITDKYGRPIILDAKPPTITGLALALGFTSRQALLNYAAKKEFIDTITRAKSRVEEYAETRLFDRDGVQGAKFNLINNFKGWSERPEPTVDDHTLEDDPLTRSLKEELRK